MYASGQSAILGTPPQMRTAPRVERSTLANLVGSAEQGCACRSVSGKAHVRKRLGDERERAPGQAQHERRSLSVLNVGWLGFEDQATAIRVQSGASRALWLRASLHQLLERVLCSR